MAKSKFFRVAVEGATATDGRTIERDWIDQMAASYNTATYGARVNMEHIRGYSPEAPFNAYGDVLALKAEDVDIEINGKVEKRRALFAQIDPTNDLVALNKKRQKLYTSIEVAPNFAGTGNAYLVGLAVTDSPASLGTEMLAFSATADNAAAAALADTFNSRKLDKANLFAASEEITLELEDEAPATGAGDVAGFMAAATAFFAKFTGSGQPAPAAQTAAVAQPSPSGDGGQALSADLTALITQFAQAADADRAAHGQLKADFAQLKTDFTALQADLAGTENRTAKRPASPGGAGAVLADC